MKSRWADLEVGGEGCQVNEIPSEKGSPDRLDSLEGLDLDPQPEEGGGDLWEHGLRGGPGNLKAKRKTGTENSPKSAIDHKMQKGELMRQGEGTD